MKLHFFVPRPFILFFMSFFTLGLNAQQTDIEINEKLLQEYKVQDTVRVNLLNNLAYDYYRSNIDKSFHFAEEAKILSTDLGFIKGKAKSISILGIYYVISAEYEKAIENFQEAIDLYKSIDSKGGIADTYNSMGIAYKNLSNYPKALECYFKAIDIAPNDKKIDVRTSKLYYNIAVVYEKQYNLSKALEFNLKSLKIKNNNKDEIGISNAYNSLSSIYLSLLDYPKAIEYLEKSIYLKEKNNYKRGLTLDYNNIGSIYYSQGNYILALEFINKALLLSKEIKYKVGVFTSHKNLGKVLFLKKDYTNALKHYERALKIVRQNDDRIQESVILLNIGQLYFELNNINKSYKYSKEAYKIAEEIGALGVMSDCSKIIIKNCKSLSLYKEAYKFFDIHNKLNDSINEIEIQKKIDALEYQNKFDKEKQDLELKQSRIDAIRDKEEQEQKYLRNIIIVLLLIVILIASFIYNNLRRKRKANKILSQQKKIIKLQSEELKIYNTELNKLNKLNTTKDKFFSIIAHDLVNPFNTLLGFSNILLENHEEYDLNKQKEYLQIINNSSKKNFNLVTNLLTWSKAQIGQIQYNPEKLNVKTIIDDIILLFTETTVNKSIKMFAEIDESYHIYTDDNMLKVVLRNLISNAIKFTPKGGSITVSVSFILINKEQSFIMIKVKDSGMGISEENQQKLFSVGTNISTKGTESETGTGLGLVLCYEFTTKMSGEIWVESELGKGSTFFLRLPSVS